MSRVLRAFAAVLLVLLASPGSSPEAQVSAQDCSGPQIDVDALRGVASAPGTRDITGFLRAIPPGSMPNFTLVYYSESKQKGVHPGTGVRPDWPRVLLSNTDGSVTVTYTCDPASETYGTVEVLHAKDGEVQTEEWDLKAPSGESRVHRNPSSCVECHSNAGKDGVPSPINGRVSLKPNWPEYHFWADCEPGRGTSVYGSADDYMGTDYKEWRPRIHENMPPEGFHLPPGCNRAKDWQAHLHEVSAFHHFKELQKDNPCYSLLPWPPGERPEDPARARAWDALPYAANETALPENMNPRTRVNLRFTDRYARLLAARNTKLIQQSPDYKKLKYLLAIEGAGCKLTPQDLAQARKLVPGIPVFSSGDHYAFDLRRSNPLLYRVGERSGMRTADWTMEFRSSNPLYMAAFSVDAMAPTVQQAVGGSILNSVMEETGIKTPKNFWRGPQNAEKYGQPVDCLKTPFWVHDSYDEDRDQVSVCDALRAENRRYMSRLANQPGTCEPQAASAPQMPAVATETEAILARADQESQEELRRSAARGRALVYGGKANCVSCHSPGQVNPKTPYLAFLPSDSPVTGGKASSLDMLKARAKNGFLEDLAEAVRSGRMPASGETLSPSEREDVINYITSLAR